VPLVFQAEPAPTLLGVTWSVTGFNNGRHAVVGPLLGTTLRMTFDQGQVHGSSGCNTYRAAYTSEGKPARHRARSQHAQGLLC
jgi:heat shock protein HslJ